MDQPLRPSLPSGELKQHDHDFEGDGVVDRRDEYIGDHVGNLLRFVMGGVPLGYVAAAVDSFYDCWQ